MLCLDKQSLYITDCFLIEKAAIVCMIVNKKAFDHTCQPLNFTFAHRLQLSTNWNIFKTSFNNKISQKDMPSYVTSTVS